MKQKLQLSNVRAQLQLTQNELARLAHISRTVVYWAEKRDRTHPVSRISAYAMLNILNPLRQDISLPALEIEDIDWYIQGEDE